MLQKSSFNKSFFLLLLVLPAILHAQAVITLVMPVGARQLVEVGDALVPLEGQTVSNLLLQRVQACLDRGAKMLIVGQSGAMALGHPIGATGAILIGTVLDELERLQVFYINIGGGEPMIRRDFFELVEYSIGKGIGVKFSTNGAFIDGHGRPGDALQEPDHYCVVFPDLPFGRPLFMQRPE